MLKVGIYGASGYTGQELLRFLIYHTESELIFLTSRRFKGVPVSDVYPAFEGLLDARFTDASSEEVAGKCDIIFSALPHGVAMNIVPELLKGRSKVVDLSADYRLRDCAVYEKWYKSHSSPDLLRGAVYGLPELYRDRLKSARLVANPGCYPTSAILALAPALKAGLLDTVSIIVDSKSGVSGAGREPKTGSLFCEVNEGFKPYNIMKHRHTPEIEQELSFLAGKDVQITFTPHLLPVNRGILSTIYASVVKDISIDQLHDAYESFYRKEQFVQVLKEGSFPNISSVKGTNNCQIGLAFDGGKRRVVIVSAIDNLVKGAAGQAIQSMNIMFGLSEDMGLNRVALFP